MAFFKKRDNKFGGDNKFRGGKGGKKFGGKSFGDERPTMHRAVCDECAQECEVPFKPSGEKPVFCRTCFKNNGGGERDSGERSFGPSRSSGKPMQKPFGGGSDDKGTEQFEILNAKLDKILKMLAQDL